MIEINNVINNEKTKQKFTFESYMTSMNMLKENGISKITNETREFVEKSRQQNYIEQNDEMVK